MCAAYTNVYTCFGLLKTQKMCDKTVEKDSKMLKFVPDYFKTQEIREKAVKKSLFATIHAANQR